jgi:hypothetical protein
MALDFLGPCGQSDPLVVVKDEAADAEGIETAIGHPAGTADRNLAGTADRIPAVRAPLGQVLGESGLFQPPLKLVLQQVVLRKSGQLQWVNTADTASPINKVRGRIKVKTAGHALSLVRLESLRAMVLSLVTESLMKENLDSRPSKEMNRDPKEPEVPTRQGPGLLQLRRQLLQRYLRSLKRFLWALLQPSKVFDPAIALIKNFTELGRLLLAGNLNHSFFSNVFGLCPIKAFAACRMRPVER